jgi:transmembrane sensor
MSRVSADDRELIKEQAARWVRSLDNATPAHRAEFWNWLRQSPEHVQEVLVATACEESLSELVIETRSLDRLEEDKGTVRSVAPGNKQIWSAARIWSIAALLAAVFLFAVVGVLFNAQLERTIETAGGEWQTEVLEDGSLLTIGPRTRLVIALTERERVVKLSGGEMLVSVEKDLSRRPFIVEAGTTRVRATGTAFKVARWENELVITVKEGSVAVVHDDSHRGESASTPAAKPATIVAGQQMTIAPDGVRVRRVDIELMMGWIQGHAIFSGETVEAAAREFNRRNTLQIKVLDPALANRPVRGVFDANEPETFVEYLTRQEGRVSKQGNVLRVEPASQLPGQVVSDHGQ